MYSTRVLSLGLKTEMYGGGPTKIQHYHANMSQDIISFREIRALTTL